MLVLANVFQNGSDATPRDVQDESAEQQVRHRLQAEQAAVSVDWLATESQMPWVRLAMCFAEIPSS